MLGLPISKMAKTKKVIINIFKFYDVKRHQFCSQKSGNLMPTLNLNVVMGVLSKKCQMSAIEAEVSFRVIKIILKSFFLHTPEHSVRSAINEALQLKREKGAWIHAANKIIRDFKLYAHIFYFSYPKYENMIKILFDDLYARIKARASPVLYTEYFPNGSIVKHIVEDPFDKRAHTDDNEADKMNCKSYTQNKSCKKFEGWEGMPPKQICVQPQQGSYNLCDLIVCRPDGKRLCEPVANLKPIPRLKTTTQSVKFCTPKPSKLPPKEKNVDLNVSRCFICKAPKLFCYCKTDKVTGLVAVDCSQGPFQCQWVHTATIKNSRASENVCWRAEYHQCPVDCTDSLDFSSSDNDLDDKCERMVCKKKTKKVQVLVSANKLHDSSDDEERLCRVLKSDLMNPLKVACKPQKTVN